MSLKMTNFAKSTLASGITDVATSLTVAAGQGALFPVLAGSDYFYAVLVNSSAQREIVKVTARTGDVMTIVRAQESTTNRAYSAGDLFAHRFTAASANEFVPASTLQSGSITYLTSVAGTNTITATIASPTPTGYAEGQQFMLKPVNTNTGATTLNIASLGAKNIYLNGQPLVGGELRSGVPALVIYDGTQFSLNGVYQVPGKQAIPIPASAMSPRSANGCAVLAYTNGAANQPDIPYLAFDGAAKEYAGFLMQMPKSWNEGTVTASFSWRRASGTGAADVVWGIRAVAVSDNETPAAAFGSDATVTDAASTTTANFNISGETSACTIAGSPADQDLVFFEVFRDGAAGADTLNAVDAWLTAVTLYITTNATSDV